MRRDRTSKLFVSPDSIRSRTRVIGSAVLDLVAGHIDLYFDTPLSLPRVRNGTLKAYAVTVDARSALAQDISTIADLGWLALALPLHDRNGADGICRRTIDYLGTDSEVDDRVPGFIH
jgi:hypothetical protein